MKRYPIRTYIILLIMIFGWTSCNDALEGEQFEKYVIITHNGFTDFVVDNSQEKVISVSVSGTTVLNKDVQVKLAVDEKALADYNFDKFRNDESLYYKLLSTDSYNIGNGDVTIKKGDEYATLSVKFDISKINKYEQYVLPISITSTSDYNIGTAGNASVLLRILLKNNYSGLYTMTGSLNDAIAGNISIGMNRYLYLLDEEDCYFYAGNTEESDKNKVKYILNIDFRPDNTVLLTSIDSDINFSMITPSVENNINSYEVITNAESGKIETINIYLNYIYYNITDPTEPVKRTVTTKLVMNVQK